MPPRPPEDLAEGLRFQQPEKQTPAPSIVIVPLEMPAAPQAPVPPPAPMPAPDTHGPEIAALRAALQQRLQAVDEKLEELTSLIAQAQADQARRVDDVAATVDEVAAKQKKLAIAVENQRRAAILMREFLDPV